jgi:hypothetical protein
LSAAEFALEIGVNARTLTYWKWKLGKAEARRGAARPEFVEVVTPATLGTSGEVSLDALEVVLGGGVVIRVPARFDADALRRVVAALEAR